MKTEVRIGLIGDYSLEVKAHTAIPGALALASQSVGCEVNAAWIPTAQLRSAVELELAQYDGLWCVPGSPYASMEGALRGIQFARERACPFLGTCGGFQHALVEYARNVLGFREADHAESNPNSAMPVIARLACSLAGAKGLIALKPGSRVSAIYGRNPTMESYQCNFGFNRRYQAILDNARLRVTGVDENGEPRVVELDNHPFFMATLFQPELSAFQGAPHPLVAAFLQAAVDERMNKEPQVIGSEQG